MNTDGTLLKINIGCGGRPLRGYINVDQDPLPVLKKRYPDSDFPEGTEVFNYNIFELPFPDNAVDEIRADSLIEHLSFSDEPRFFLEVKRVLSPGGLFDFSTTDFEEIVKLWLKAKDEWKDFYRSDDEAIAQKHWFGQYSYGTESRWGYLTAMIFGSQNGEGQFHRNCYTVAKIRAILEYIGFRELEISKFLWKGDRDPMLRVRAVKAAIAEDRT